MKNQTHNLSDFLEQIPDFRRDQGKRFPLKAFLSMIIMAIISGHNGYREFARFFKSNAVDLISEFDLKHGVPSHVTIRTILLGIDLVEIKNSFRQWALQTYKDDTALQEVLFMSLDGKTLKSTLEHPNTSLQDFVNIINVFAHHTELSLAFEQFQSKTISEPSFVQQMIQTLGLKGVVYRLDAAHCKKKHLT